MWNEKAKKPAASVERIRQSSYVAPNSISGIKHMDIAMAELGQSEIKGSEHNARIIEYFTATNYHASDDETPWCAAFVNWVLVQSNIATTRSAAALSFVSWGAAVDKPRYGDLIIINRGRGRGHVGFFVGYDNQGRLGCLGGNQSNSVNISWFDTDVEYQFRRQRKLRNTRTGMIAGFTATILTGWAAIKAYFTPTAAQVGDQVAQACAAGNTGFDLDTTITAGLALTDFLQVLPIGGPFELIVGAAGAVLVAIERARKLRKFNN